MSSPLLAGQTASATDRPLGGENFPVALRILPRELRRHLLAVYAYARYVDDVGDTYCGDRVAALQALADDVDRLGAGEPPLDPVVAGLATTVERCRIPSRPFRDLVEANLMDQKVNRYDTFEDLLAYCRLSANPVGEIVLYVVGCATEERLALSDRVCTGLQLLEHWQDVSEDYHIGRVYLPQEDLCRFGVTEEELGRTRATPEVRALIGYQTDRALAWLNAGAPLVSTLTGWARLAVSLYVAGGRAAALELRRCGHDPLPRQPKPRGRDVAARWLEATVRWPG